MLIRLRMSDGEPYRVFDVDHINIDMIDKKISYIVDKYTPMHGGWSYISYDHYVFTKEGDMTYLDVWTGGR